MTDLGTPPGESSMGTGINNAGQVVGHAYGSSGPADAFLYSNGQMTDLNTLIDPGLHLTLSEATAINDESQIVANTAIFCPKADVCITPTFSPRCRSRAPGCYLEWRC